MENASVDADMVKDLEEMWVFGYGSILWNPGFSYESCRVGFIEGYSRRFWQGSTTHRGTPQSPGRVATLVQHTGSRTWGMAFHVVGQSLVRACLECLGLRECRLGGYSLRRVAFREPCPCPSDAERLLALVFIASPCNHLYLGPAAVDELARQVVKCRGLSGSNVEYVTRLADFVRRHIPNDDDKELFELDDQVRRLMTSDHLLKVSDSDSVMMSPGTAAEHCDVAARQIRPPTACKHRLVTVPVVAS